MKSKYSTERIYSNDEISKNVYRMVVEGDYDLKPGQFYMMRAWKYEPYLSRPISVHAVGDNGIEFLYQVFGEGTALFSDLKKGDNIDLLGPLGNGFDIEEISGKVAVVVGGIGIAPMYEVMKKLKEKDQNIKIDLYAGFRDDIYSVDYMKEYADELILATEDGSTGYKGYVIDLLDCSKYDYILSCGPTPMMKALKKMTEESGTKAYFSLEDHMACGVGACLGCTCNTTRGKERICKEGPVFLGEDVKFDD
ncbi:MAG: dihydroorotate dehydrogenase electron transfer subunit [Andreesenia angusta]|nr:dihydroorotate dehydrogenase electron transfer subunit [Andreesenia angusta]